MFERIVFSVVAFDVYKQIKYFGLSQCHCGLYLCSFLEYVMCTFCGLFIVITFIISASNEVIFMDVISYKPLSMLFAVFKFPLMLYILPSMAAFVPPFLLFLMVERNMISCLGLFIRHYYLLHFTLFSLCLSGLYFVTSTCLFFYSLKHLL